jgi:tetratricopeptide (TPR) repeat protein
LTWIVNSVTFALFTPWALCMLYRWQIDGLIVGDKELVDHFPPVHTSWRAVLITFLMGLLVVAAAGFFIFEEIKFQIDAFHQGSLKEKGVLKSRIVRSRPKPLPPSKVAEVNRKREKTAPVVQSDKKKTNGEPAQTQKAPPIKPETNIQDLEKKIKKADLYIKENPENEMAYYNRAFLYASKGEYDRAIKDYTEAIRINPNNADAYYNRGMVWTALKNYDKAVQDFQKVIAIKPAFEDAYCNRGNGYYSLGKYDLAVRDYGKALEINPRDGDVYFNRGLAYLALKQRGKALSDFEKALQLGQKKAEVYLKQTKDQ